MNRRQFIATSSALLAVGKLRAPSIIAPYARPRPSLQQLDWQRDERAMFIHFGVNTFTDREWGDGTEDPSIFNPTQLDALQWARAAKAGGFRAMILTAKHHDGFCLWPTETTRHSVASSPWRGGEGDVVREFVDACNAEGLRAGVYLSPWDRNHPTYGDSRRYNDVYAAQLTELMARYGPLSEVWFDGANGEGPNGKRQVYDWPRVFSIVRKLQPNAVIFSDAGPDIRWCGNEKGSAGDPNWSMVDPTTVPYPGADGPAVIEALQHGDPRGTVWRPAEADVSIRPGWFHHPAQDDKVRSVDNLVDLYCQSVGRNSKLLLNVPPTRDGLLHATDVERLAGFRERLGAMFAKDVAAAPPHFWRPTGDRTATLEIGFTPAVTIDVARLAENVPMGQRISGYTLSGLEAAGWRTLSKGTTIGYAKIERFPAATVTLVRLSIDEAVEAPESVSVALYMSS